LDPNVDSDGFFLGLKGLGDKFFSDSSSILENVLNNGILVNSSEICLFFQF